LRALLAKPFGIVQRTNGRSAAKVGLKRGNMPRQTAKPPMKNPSVA
jgi:hypothetical protein